MTKKNKRMEIMLVYGLLLTALSIILQNYDNTPFFSVAALPVVVTVALTALKRQNWLFMCFYGLCAEIYYVMVLCIYIIAETETSWRFLYNHEVYSTVSFPLALSSMLIMSMIYIFIMCTSDKGTGTVYEPQETVMDIRTLMFIAVYVVILLYYVVMLPTLGMRNYAESLNAMMIALFRSCCLIGWLLISSAKGNVRKLLIAVSAAALVVIVMLSVSGYRYLMVENAVMIVFLNLSRFRHIKFRTWASLAILVIVMYVMLTVIKSNLTGRTMGSLVFNHEKNIFYSLNAVIANMGEDRLYTYLSTLKNLLPKALTGSTDPNTGGMLMRYIKYDMYLQNNVTMGGYYLTEAYANFHEAGVYFASVVFAVVFSAIEKRRAEKPASPLFMCIYYGLISQTYNFVYYGSSNYVKFLVYYIIFAMVILFPLRKTESARRLDSQK